MDKKTATLDLTDCKYLGEMHQRIKKSLNFPNYYGENWDAFWDCINADCDVDFITVIGINTLSKELKKEAEIMISLLEDNKKYWADVEPPFDYEIVL